MWTEIIIAVCVSLVISLMLNRLMLELAPRLGLMDEPGERRVHSKAIPRAGGIAIWVTFMLVMTSGLLVRFFNDSGHVSWPWLGAFAAGSAVLMVAGILDDRHGLRALVKLGAHILAPVVFFIIHPIETGIFPQGWGCCWDLAVFVVWAVVLINAFNLIDGLDGLCGGLAVVATFALAALAMTNGRTDAAVLLAVMGGAILGFLKYNYNPARIFLGDAGSMVIGFFLATAATDAVGRKAVMGVIMLPIAVAGVPLLDVLLAIWRRGARRVVGQLNGDDHVKGIFDADGDHLHHRLLRAGGSQRKVAGILQAIAILLAFLAFMPMFLGDRLMGVSLVGFMIVFLAGVRNLARVEIENTGSAVHLAIKLPRHRRRMAAILFIYDLMVLTISAGLAVMIETNRFSRGAPWQDLTKFVMLFAILGSVALLVVRVHQRLWVRATVRDLLSLQFWLMLAAFATFTLFSLIFQQMEWSALRMTAISLVIAGLGVAAPRVALDLFREFGLEARHKNPGNTVTGCGPVVVLGAGDLGALFLDHLKSSLHDEYPGMKVLGFVDETELLHGRRIRAFRILGGLSMVPQLVKDRGLKGIVLAIKNPREEMINQLTEMADRYDLKIYRWKVGLEEM